MVRDYELVTIWNPDLAEDEFTTSVDRLSSSIGGRGGQVTDTNVWGRRRLAYSIDKHGEGVYVVMELKLDPATTSDLESQLRINENVLRHLLVRKDE